MPHWSAVVQRSREAVETAQTRAISSSVSTDCVASASDRTGSRQTSQRPEPNHQHAVTDSIRQAKSTLLASLANSTSDYTITTLISIKKYLINC